MKRFFRETLVLHIRAIRLMNDRTRHLFLSYTLHAIIGSLFPYVGIWLSAQIINELAGDRRPEILWPLVAITLVSTVTLTLLSDVVFHWKMARRAMCWNYLRKIYADKMVSMDFCVLDDPGTHEKYAKIRENDNFSGWGITKVIFYYETFMSALFRILGAVVLTVSLFTTPVPETAGRLALLGHPVFVPIVIALLLLVTLLGPLCNRKADVYWSKTEEEHKLNNRLFEVFGFLPLWWSARADYRMYHQQDICDYYNDKNRNYMPGSRIARYAAGPMGIYRGLASAAAVIFVGLVYVFVCLKAAAGAFGVGSVTQYIGAITALSQSLGSLLSLVSELKVNGTHLQTTFEFLDTPNHMVHGEKEAPKDYGNYEIEFRDVSFCYPGAGEKALSHVSITFRAGDKLALVGRNGSGKTTFIKLLCRLYDPTEGEILLNGVNIKDYDYESYLDIFSVVFQDFQLFSFPIGQNVAADYEYDPDKAKACLAQAGFERRMEELPKGLDTYLYTWMEDDGIDISGGEGQKIAIARALYKDAGIVVLDEPTAALDPLAEEEIYTRFSDMVAGKTAIYISHRLSSCRFCDCIAVFDKGQITEVGHHDELVKAGGHYATLWEAQAQYYK